MSKLQLPKYPLTSIPSGGIAYPEDWCIEITPYTFGQSSGIKETDITQRRFYNYILDGVYTNFDKSFLIIEDIFFISVARKLISTKTSKITVNSVCPECLNDNKISMDLKEAIQYEKSKISSREKYPVKVTFSKYIGWFRYLTLDESLELLRSNSKNTGIIDNMIKRTVKLVEIVGEDKEKIIFDEKQRDKAGEELLKTVYESFVDDDSQTLEDLLEIFNSIKMAPLKITCQEPSCQAVYEQELNIGGLSDILTPFRDEKKGKTKNTIDI